VTTTALVCQPQLGASLRKASARLLGTAVGAIAIVLLTALFPQETTLDRQNDPHQILGCRSPEAGAVRSVALALRTSPSLPHERHAPMGGTAR
jgi:hypothetical protein